MRIRTIKPEFWQNEELSLVTPEALILAAALLNYADDEGWFRWHTRLIESQLFPLREFSVSFHSLLAELSSAAFITRHEGSDGKEYGHICTFLDHQRISRPTPSRISPIISSSTTSPASAHTHGVLSEDSAQERKGKEGKGEEGKDTHTPSGSRPDRAPTDHWARLCAAFPNASPIPSSAERLLLSEARPILDTWTPDDWAALRAWNTTTDALRGCPLWPRNRREALANIGELPEKLRPWWGKTGRRLVKGLRPKPPTSPQPPVSPHPPADAQPADPAGVRETLSTSTP